MEYFLLKPDGEQAGTFSIEQIRDMLRTGFIGSDTRYWHEGITEWRPIDRIEESLDFQPPPPPPSRTIPPQKLAAALKAVPPPGTKLEKSRSSPVKAGKNQDPFPAVPTSLPSRIELPTGPEIPREAAPAPTQVADAVRPRRKRIVGWIVYAINVTVVALAIDYAGPAVHYVSDLLQRKVTLASGDAYVVVDRSLLKSFADEMRNSPGADDLRHQIGQTADPNALMRLNIELEKVTSWHTGEVEQRFIQIGKGEFIDPGTYPLLDYLDDKGDPINPHDGNPVWMAILYKDQTVYAFKKADSTQATQSP